MDSTRPVEDDRSESSRVIDNYRLLEKLGEGGMGEVWLADQQEPVRRRVALKIVKHGMDTAQVIGRFAAERQALALMDHPAIAKIFDAGTTPRGRPYFVMEHVPGVPITEHCDRQRLTTRERLDLFLQVCEGVQHAHQKAVLHRDLKPSNVLVSVRDGRAAPKIIDFGVAKATAQRLTEQTLYTELGVLIGTPEYMSPEQAEMTGQDVDTRTDVYSLGVILYELLVGALPYERGRLRAGGYDGIRRILRGEEHPKPSTRLTGLGKEGSTDSAGKRRVDVPSLRRQLTGDLDWITMKALEKDRARRYGSSAELAEDVRRHLRNEPVLAGPPSTPYRMRKFVRRHRVGVALAGILLASLVVGLVGAAYGLARARRAEAEARKEAATSERVSAFLADLLGSVDPARMGQRVVTGLEEGVAEARRKGGATAEEAATAASSLEEALQGVNRTDQARRILDEEVLSRAGAKVDAELSRDPLIAARLQDTIGQTYARLGLYHAAESYCHRALEIRRQTLGEEHPDTLSSMSNLATIYLRQDRYKEAESLEQKALGIRRRIPGPEHPVTLTSMSNLAVIYEAQGRHDEAEQLLQQALGVSRRVLGEEHLDTLKAMTNLAVTYNHQGRFEEAVQLNQKVFDIRRRTEGREHPDTLQSMKRLATGYADRGRLEEATRLLEDALDIQRRVLGLEDPQSVNSMMNLAALEAQQGHLDKAEQLLKETVDIQRRVLGEEHSSTLDSMGNLAALYSVRGRIEEAIQLQQRTLAIRRRVLGEEDFRTLRSMFWLATAYRNQGREV